MPIRAPRLPYSARNLPLLSPWLAAVLILLGALSTLQAERFVSGKIADGFDFPVGRPDAKGYYKARGFWPNGHLGEDWNGRGGGNTDLGDPVYSIGHGIVVYSDDFGAGWGNVVIIRHAYREKNGRIYYIDSLYGHLQKRQVGLGSAIVRGQQVGTIGRGPRNMYYAHLHFEIRKNLAIGMNRSKYKRDYSNYHSPTHFLAANRRLRPEHRRVRIPVDTFLKSNPNTFTSVTPELDSGLSHPGRRPTAPEEVREAMERNPSRASSGSVAEDTPGFWTRIKSSFRKLFGKD